MLLCIVCHARHLQELMMDHKDSRAARASQGTGTAWRKQLQQPQDPKVEDDEFWQRLLVIDSDRDDVMNE
jgi:hypothetical protein